MCFETSHLDSEQSSKITELKKRLEELTGEESSFQDRLKHLSKGIAASLTPGLVALEQTKLERNIEDIRATKADVQEELDGEERAAREASESAMKHSGSE